MGFRLSSGTVEVVFESGGRSVPKHALLGACRRAGFRLWEHQSSTVKMPGLQLTPIPQKILPT